MNLEEKYIVEEIIMEATQEDGSVIRKRVKINGKKYISAEEWEDIKDGSNNN
ncbi:MAG: hypothetical protein WA125_06250 [Desulfosporosinus sp.]